jgi:hypothetical protein
MLKLSTHYVRNILTDLVKGASGAKFIEYQGPTMPMVPEEALAFFKTSQKESQVIGARRSRFEPLD